jgi:hypothetical protein
LVPSRRQHASRSTRTQSADSPQEVRNRPRSANKTQRTLIPHICSQYGGRDLGEPTRLAFLLDHEYTEKGLAAGRLKGADAERVVTLRAAAEQAGCQSVLALAEIKETWDVLSAGEPWRQAWYDDEDDEDDADHDDDDYELNELVDDEITLGWWSTPDGSDGEVIRLGLDGHEVCAVTPTRSLTPYETAYEGYMGNYGNTFDRWYRRAAVVVWPKDKGFAARAEAAPAWALRTSSTGSAPATSPAHVRTRRRSSRSGAMSIQPCSRRRSRSRRVCVAHRSPGW